MLKKYKVLHDLPFIKKGDTVSEYDDDVVSDVKYISEMNEDDADLSFYKCYHNKKQVKVDIKHEVVITIQE